jgi:UDP-4-amino-4-deoxy-L-arabinose formyltransferase/UDP-glucuronic acid dehydrogenase (UDP-4-keto-hexauronic acid decarboxylating)
MSAVVLAYHEMGCMGLRVLLERGVRVAAVFSYEDDPHESCWFGSVVDLARAEGIPCHTPEGLADPTWVERIASLAPDVLFSFYYRHLVGKRILAIPRHGCVNLHGSLLPRYRGRSPLNWQLVNGEEVSGITLHHMVPKADAGDIVDQESVAVGPDDTALDLYEKLLGAGRRVLERRIDELLTGKAPRRAQDESLSTCVGRRTPEDGCIDWSRSAREIHNLVRAVAPPWPGAFCDTPMGRVMIWRTRVWPAATVAAPGTISCAAGGTPRVSTGAGELELCAFSAPPGVTLSHGDDFAGSEGDRS